LPVVRHHSPWGVYPGDRHNLRCIEPSVATVSAFVVAFLGSVALWWLYFASSEEAARRTFSSSEDPGRLGRSAYTYFHIPMIAGIIAVAAADELTVAHPADRGTAALAALFLGGTALFLGGHALFKWAVFGVLSLPRVVAIAALVALIPVGFVVPALALGVAVALIVAALAVWDTLAYRGGVHFPRDVTK
jgi:low temperature requirement protein LtrA